MWVGGILFFFLYTKCVGFRLETFLLYMSCYNRWVMKQGCKECTLIVTALRSSIIRNFCVTEEFFMDKKIEVLSTTRIKYSSDLYKIVDSLNRTLKEQDLMFGLALDEKIKKQLYLRFTERSDTMKKWIFAIIIVIVASGIYGAYVYNKAMGKKIPKESKFVEIAKEKQSLQR